MQDDGLPEAGLNSAPKAQTFNSVDLRGLETVHTPPEISITN